MSDKNNDMGLGIAIGGAGGLCLFVIYKLFSSMSETREQLRRQKRADDMFRYTPRDQLMKDSLLSPWGEKRLDDGWNWSAKSSYPDAVSIGGKRKSRRKTKRRRKSRRTKRRRRKR
jgi:hypothetical protein